MIRFSVGCSLITLAPILLNCQYHALFHCGKYLENGNHGGRLLAGILGWAIGQYRFLCNDVFCLGRIIESGTVRLKRNKMDDEPDLRRLTSNSEQSDTNEEILRRLIRLIVGIVLVGQDALRNQLPKWEAEAAAYLEKQQIANEWGNEGPCCAPSDAMVPRGLGTPLDRFSI